MATIVDSLNRIARQCSVKAPSSWVTATRDDHVELRDDFMLEAVDDILDRVDLPSPIGAQVVLSTLASSTNTDGSRTFILPSTFKQLHRNEWSIYDPDQDRPCIPITQDGLFTYIADTGTAGVVHYFVLEGYEGNWTLKFYRDPGSTSTITVSYNTVNWMANAGTAGSTFTDETDVFLLPRRLVESGTVWRYRERKGMPYLDKYNEYEALIARLSNDRRARRAIDMGGHESTIRWQDLVPAEIPPS